MLKKKMMRDIFQNKSQFFTIFLMVLIGIMVYTGIESYMLGMINAADKFYQENNLQDLNVYGSFNNQSLEDIKKITNVKDAEKKLVVTGTDADDKDKTYLISFIELNNISKFYVLNGKPFNYDQKGVWVDNFYAKANNLKVGDTLNIFYDNITLKETIIGLINVPDHIYDVKDESEIVPDRNKFGFIYLSSKELPSSYIKKMIMTSQNITSEKVFNTMFPNFNYLNYIPYNNIMVDVNDKSNVEAVKLKIEDNITNVSAIVKSEDTASYKTYQGEIDEGKSYVGIFSGLFLFIAALSVITTMTRVVKKQKLQIGTLKALGFPKKTIIKHYVGYGFWVSLLGAIFGVILGRFVIGSIFLNLEMSFFEVPNGVPIIAKSTYLVALNLVFVISLITYLVCFKELKKKPAESLRASLTVVKKRGLNLTTKKIFKKLSFSSKWNIRDILRNKIRTFTGVFGIVGCCMLIVCAFGMLDSMNNFIKIQFEDLYNFKYKITLKDDVTSDELKQITKKYGNFTSETLMIEIKDDNNNRLANNIFITNASNKVRFMNNKEKFITLDSKDGIYITYKLAESLNKNVGDTISWHIYGNNKYYTSKIVGLNKDPQNQNITMTKEYLESLNLSYKPDSVYTDNDENVNLSGISVIQNIDSIKDSTLSLLSMMKQMIMLIIFFAILLGAIIIYNMGILSFSEKELEFATLKVLGFKNKQIKKIFIKQNIWITFISILIGIPSGYYLTSWLFKKCLNDNFDFGVHINLSTYIIAVVGTFLTSYVVSSIIAKKINKIDMVSSLKGNE